MNNSKTATLIKALETFPEQWALTPVHNKAPKIKNWQKGIDRSIIIKELEAGRANGIGLITGELSGCILAIDCDGPTAHQLAEKLGGLPHTVSFTSGKDGRAQYLYLVPPEYREILKGFTRKVLETGTKGEQLEIRYNASQSVVPPSRHPDTPGYIWINSFEDTPSAGCPTWVIEQILVDTDKPSNPDQLPLNFNNRSDEPIPLIQCLSREHREWVASGIGQGGRNSNGAELARDLIGTESRLHDLGIPYSDSARGLFDDYCDRCNPPINNGERETIWRSAQKDNPIPCLDDAKLENCYKAWQRKQRQPSKNISKTNYQTSGNTALKPETQSNVLPFQRQEPSKLPPIKEALKALLEQNLSRADLDNELLELSAIYPRYSKNDIEKLYRKLSEEEEEKESQIDIKIELDELLKNKNQSLNLSEYLPGNLSKISEFASRLCLRPELGLSAFLTVTSSLLAVGTDIDLLMDYCQFDQKSLGMYTAICAEPSQKKSPLINKIALEPLLDIQEEARKQYEQEMVNYQIDLADWASDKNNPDPEPKKPIIRRYFISGGTQAGIRNVLNTHSQNGWGLLVLTDELAASYKNNSKTYNAGILEDFLTYYDGYGKSEALNEGFKGDFSRCLVAMLGGIQPGVISNYMNGSDGNGHWSRVSVVNQPVSPFLIPDNLPGKLDLKPMLVDFYKKVSQLPQLHFTLDAKAKSGFITINNKCELYRVGAKTQALASLWGKMPGKIGRFAALLHIIDQVWQFGTVQSLIVEKITLDRAVKLAKFFYHESYSLYSDCSQDKTDLAPQLVRILGIAEKKQKAISASDVKRFDRELSKLAPDDIRQMFTQLVELGYGELEGKGCSLKFKNTQIIDKNRQIIDKIVDAEITATQELQPIIDKIDKKNKNLENEPKTTQLADIPHIESEAENVKYGERLSILSTIGCNPDTVNDTASTDLSTERLFLSIISDDDSSERPSEPISSEPLDFDHIAEGDILFDGEGNPHRITGHTRQLWETHRKQYISRNDILQGKFHRATVEDVTKLIERTIKGKNKTQAKWLCDVYGGESDSLMAKAIDTNPEELALIFDFDCWE